MRLSPHFTLEELTYSDTAKRYGIDNTPSKDIIKNLGYLTANLLEPLRDRLKKPITITSGYRCDKLNTKVGGSKYSQHRYGQAADIKVKGWTPRQLYYFIKDQAKNNGLVYDQLILEHTSTADWVHVSYSKHNRKQNLLYDNGRYKYDI